jgi:pimeloyl-ACP methyl ester carboxylesterase
LQDKFYCFGIFFCWKVRISWKKDHPNYLSYLPRPKEPISPKTVQLQGQAVASRKGSCNRLANITKPTLVIVGTEDAVTPPANSIILAQKIPVAWLVQINGGGHGAMYQYPDEFSNVLLTFLNTA